MVTLSRLIGRNPYFSNKYAASPMTARHSAAMTSPRFTCSSRRFGGFAADDALEGLEEFPGQLLRRRFHQPAAQLRQLAANLGGDLISQPRTFRVLLQPHSGRPLGETRRAGLAAAGDGVAFGDNDIGKSDLALEGGFHRADLGDDCGGKFVVRYFFQSLAPRYGLGQNVGIVERREDRLGWRMDQDFVFQFHVGLLLF
jgi:hypothetical protein